MTKEISNNSRIAKNTLYLYLRMFITMAVGLYTSRVVLQTLGIDDYGIYNIVGGIVILFSFISNALRNATQRFLSFEIGKTTDGNVQKIFNISIQSHIIICLLLFLLAETIGLWFCLTQLNVPVSRENIINYVYQFSVITFLVQVIQVPFYSAIISYERMSFYTYISILESFIKLVLVYLLIVSPWDKLVVYSALIAVASVIILLANVLYCIIKLGLNSFYIEKDKHYFKSMMSFSGWSMANGCATMFSQQGANYFMNIFSGVAANAAFGIANQVSAIIYSFVSNFQSAFQPQIVKQYAAKDYDTLNKLIFRSSLLSYYLLLLIVISFGVEANYLLEKWLGVVPDNTSIFCILLLCYFLIDAIQAPIWMLTYGTGNIKKYTIVTAIMTILNLPLAWLLLYYQKPLYSIFVVKILLNICCCVYRMIYVNKHINFPSLEYVKKVGFRAICVTMIILVSIRLISLFNIQPVINILISCICSGMIILLLGFDSSDRKSILLIFKRMISK